MARLIDTEKLVPKHYVQRTDKIIGYEGTQPIYEYKDVVAYDIDNAPTVDAELVRHGRWEKPQRHGVTIYDQNAYAECSCCLMVQYLAKGMNYCPNCGAKMDEEKENGK